jgi:hypothetical protein
MWAKSLMPSALACALLSGACNTTHFNDAPRPAIGPGPRKCALALAETPEVRGFRLGMSYAELQKRFPKLSEPASAAGGVSTVVISGRGNQPAEKGYPDLEDVNSVELTLAGDRAVSYKITYPETKDFDSVSEFQFLNKDGKALEGVKAYVEEDPDRNYGRKVVCDGFIVRADIGKRNVILTGGAEGRTYFPWIEVEDIAASARAKLREEESGKSTEAVTKMK